MYWQTLLDSCVIQVGWKWLWHWL